jgi:hypothetical protein
VPFPIHQEEVKPLIFPRPEEQGPQILSTPVIGGFFPLFNMRQLEGAENIKAHEDFKKDLEIKTCDSIFNSDGTLRDSVVDESTRFLEVGDFNPGRVRGALSGRGEIKDWGKYYTPKFHTPTESQDIGSNKRNTTAEVHFYKNKKTGEVYYDLDYKIKYDLSNNPQKPVNEFLEELPEKWRPKL